MNNNRRTSNFADWAADGAIEPERYELAEPPAYDFSLDRREWLKALGGGILVFTVRDAWAQESGGGRRRRSDNDAPQDVGAWLHIRQDGSVTVYTGKAEVGQNIRTSLTQAVAEELRVPVASIEMVMGDTDLTPFDMGTFGSRTTPFMAPQLRKAAATAREMLIDLAAKLWEADRKKLVVADGRVTDPETTRSVTFGELTEGQKLARAIPESVDLTPAKEWKISARNVPKINGPDFVTGKHRYPSDIKLPEMWYGKVLRPASFEATLTSLDTSRAEAMAGVKVVRDGAFVGVAAPSERQAEAALAAIQAAWKPTPQPDSREVFEYFKKNLVQAQGFDGGRRQEIGSIQDGFAAADKTVERSYTVAYIAHAPLEPRAAVAQWTDGKLTVWTGTQRPFGVKGELAEAFHLPESKVRVIMPDMGSGYGGKHTGEAAVEAARLAKAVGRPVKVVWTREEEFSWAYARPGGLIEVRSGVKTDGTITAWEFHNYNSGGAAIDGRYDIPNRVIEFHATRSPLRQGSYRGLAATANHFARESHMDELAHELGIEPLEFRRKNCKDERLLAVLDAAAERFGWGARPKPGRGHGIAGGFEKGSYVASCAEISIDQASGAVKVERVVTAFECGAIVNPDQLKNQAEGAVIMGLGGALFEALDFADGKLKNPRFSQYRVPRFRDIPVLETILLDRKDLASAGAGETPIVALAPAVGNAIFQATGRRLRSLPLVPHGLKTV
jgi:isoquinoline 1-oxidoreductase